MLTKIYQKTCIATALGVAMLGALPVQAATWADRNPAGNIEISGSINAVTLPGAWEWAVGGKNDFDIKLIDTPMEPGQKIMKIKLTDDLPILAGRINTPIFATSSSNISVTYPAVTVPAGTFQGVAQDNTRPQGLLVRAPINLEGATAVVGYATFEATGAGVTHTSPTALTPGSTFTTQALAPANASNNLCSGLVGNVPNDNTDAVDAANTWLGRLDALLVPTSSAIGPMFLAAAQVADSSLTPADAPTAAPVGAKFTGRHSAPANLVLTQCGIGAAQNDHLILTFNNIVNVNNKWEVKLSPTVQYN